MQFIFWRLAIEKYLVLVLVLKYHKYIKIDRLLQGKLTLTA
jgi:hypothetical protein